MDVVVVDRPSEEEGPRALHPMQTLSTQPVPDAPVQPFHPVVVRPRPEGRDDDVPRPRRRHARPRVVRPEAVPHLGGETGGSLAPLGTAPSVGPIPGPASGPPPRRSAASRGP